MKTAANLSIPPIVLNTCKWSEWGELELIDVLFIKPSLDLFVTGKTGVDGELPVGWCVRIKDIHNKKCSGEKFPRNHWPECLLERYPQWLQMHITLWPSRCWRTGSKVILWQTSDRRLCVMSQFSLRRCVRKALLGHDKVCSTVNGSLHAHWDGSWSGS